MILHKFQDNLVKETRQAMVAGHKRIIIQSPTGSGKTVIFSHIVRAANGRANYCLIITDREELLSGTDKTLKAFGLDTTFVRKGAKIPPLEYGNCIAMSQTLRRRLNSELWLSFINKFAIVIIDEGHVAEFDIYFTKEVFLKSQIVLSFTATPKRDKKQRQLSDDYTKLIIGPQVPRLITDGFLVPDKYYAPRVFSVEGLSKNSFGDYKESEMFDKFNKVNLYNGLVKNWKELALDTITIVFCVNIQHCVNTAKAFNEAGIEAKFIVSPLASPVYEDSMTDAQFEKFLIKKKIYDSYLEALPLYSGDRRKTIKDWKSGKFKVLINAGILTKGFDYKQIETVCINRATTSETLWLQMLGRGSRIYPTKTHFNVLDFGSNAERLGFYNQERVWSLIQNGVIKDGVAPVKECGKHHSKLKLDKYGAKGCGCLVLASNIICPYCAYIFEKDIFDIEIDLVQIDYSITPISKFKDIERMAEERGYHYGWTIRRIISEGGLANIKEYSKHKDYQSHWVNRIEKQYSLELDLYEQKILLKNK